jgi:ribose/xylose/arabinose/galactoside ABC-type transport system permease subunit
MRGRLQLNGGTGIRARLGIALALAVETALFASLSPHFLTTDNILNVTLQTSITAIIAAGMTFVILTGGIDLSVGSLVALVGVIAALVARASPPQAWGLVAAVGAGLAAGAGSGYLAGLCIARFRVTPFIVTLALMTVWRGAAFIITEGRPVWELPAAFSIPGGGRLGGIPIPTLLMAAVFTTAHVLLAHTKFGRHVLAVGGNREAARLAGINTGRILVQAYVLCGALTALSGVLLASRLSSGQPNAGLMYELDAIAAVVVGGARLTGGRGTIVGTFIGAMLIGVLRNGLNLLDVGSYVQQVIVGAVILLAVMFDTSRKD